MVTKHQIRILAGRVVSKNSLIADMRDADRASRARIMELSDLLLKKNQEVQAWRHHSMRMNKLLSGQPNLSVPVRAQVDEGELDLPTEPRPSSSTGARAGDSLPPHTVRSMILAAADSSEEEGDAPVEQGARLSRG